MAHASRGGTNSKVAGASFATGFPLFDPERVLGCAVNSLACDHHLARYGPVTNLHPELPVGIRIAKCEVLAFDAIDHPTPHVLGLHYVGNEHLIRIRKQHIGAGQGDAVP